MDLKRLRVAFALLAVVWAGVIFAFSSQDSVESARTSGNVSQTIAKVFIRGEGEAAETQREETALQLDAVIRKVAHASVYFLLGALILGALSDGNTRRAAFIAFILSVLYSFSDELHQYFVPGRACRFYDVLIDSAGALAGIGCLTLALSLARRGADKRKK